MSEEELLDHCFLLLRTLAILAGCLVGYIGSRILGLIIFS